MVNGFTSKFMQKKILIASLILNLGLLILIFQFRDKISARLFPPEKTTILLVGDSRIAQENWSVLLSRNDVKNEAFGGAITQQILWNLERGQLNSKPKIVVLEGGINDLLAGVPPQRVYENYLKIIEILQAKKIEIIVNSIVYTTDSQDINNNILDFNSQLKDFCTTHKIAWLDMNEQLSQDGKLLKKYSLDGIHLSKEVYRIWAEKLRLLM
jgi:lysophospholipase L1-like esterase